MASRDRPPAALPEAPTDPRLTVAGARTDGSQKLLDEAYVDLKAHFQGEPPKDQHPQPNWPGLRLEEVDLPRDGLRWWSDAKGEGWVAIASARDGVRKTESKWFSRKKWDSWRLSYLLAKLQRDVWQKGTPVAEGGAAERPKPEAEPPRGRRGGPGNDRGRGRGRSQKSAEAGAKQVQQQVHVDPEAVPLEAFKAVEPGSVAREPEGDGLEEQLEAVMEDDVDRLMFIIDTDSEDRVESATCEAADWQSSAANGIEPVQEAVQHMTHRIRQDKNEETEEMDKKEEKQDMEDQDKTQEKEQENVKEEKEQKEDEKQKTDNKGNDGKENEETQEQQKQVRLGDKTAGHVSEDEPRPQVPGLTTFSHGASDLPEDDGHASDEVEDVEIIIDAARPPASDSVEAGSGSTSKKRRRSVGNSSGKEESPNKKRGRPKASAASPRAAPLSADMAREETASEDVLGEDPEDPRLCASTAICSCDGLLVLSAYNDLKAHFVGEPQPEAHPAPAWPGLRQSELGLCLDGLKPWSDAKGAGWIAYSKHRKQTNKHLNRWFSASTWGSWRLAFLLARLQREVWDLPELPSTASASSSRAPHPAKGGASSSGGSGEETKQILAGTEEWLAFTPREIDLKLCLARLWNGGFGAQCNQPRPDGMDLCRNHQQAAISTKGLNFGYVTGPIPAVRLAEFQQAALTISSKMPVHAVSRSAPSSAAAAQEAPHRAPRTAPSKPKAKAKMKRGFVPRVLLGATTSATSEKTSPRPTGSSGEMAVAIRAEEPHGLGKHAAPPERSAKRLRAEIKLKLARQAAAPKNNTADSAGSPTKGQYLLSRLLDDQGRVIGGCIKKVLNMMPRVVDVEARLAVVKALRRTAEADNTAAFQILIGGIAALKPWLQSVLQGDARQSAGHIPVMLEGLALLRELPITLQCLTETRIGQTVHTLALRCQPARDLAKQLVSQWRTRIAPEAIAKAQEEAARSAAQTQQAPSSANSAEPLKSSRPPAVPQQPQPYLISSSSFVSSSSVGPSRPSSPNIVPPASRDTTQQNINKLFRHPAPPPTPPPSSVGTGTPSMGLPRPSANTASDHEDPSRALLDPEVQATIRQLKLLDEELNRGNPRDDFARPASRASKPRPGPIEAAAGWEFHDQSERVKEIDRIDLDLDD